MKKELEKLDKDIQNAEEALQALRKQRAELKEKIEGPIHLIGKYIKAAMGPYTYYLKVKKIAESYIKGEFHAEGVFISKCVSSTSIEYELQTLGTLDLDDEFTEIGADEFNDVLLEAIGKFGDLVNPYDPFDSPITAIRPKFPKYPNGVALMYGTPYTEFSAATSAMQNN